MITLIVVLAFYVSFGRLLMSAVQQYDRQILRAINTRLPFTIEASKVSGGWHFFSPELVFTGLKITIPGSTEPPIELTAGRVTVDVLQSLQTRSLQVSKLQLDSLSLKAELSAQGKFSIVGFDQGNSDISEWLEQFILNIERLDLTDNRLALALPNEQQRRLQLDLTLQRNGSSRTLEAKIHSQTTGTQFSLIAEGVGNPLSRKAFVGELYLKVDVTDLNALQELVKLPVPVNIRGDLQAEFWLGWDRGDSTVAFNLHGIELEFSATDDSWQLPADEISMQASMVERKDHWTIFISDFEFYKGAIQLRLPRLQLDTWGDSLRLRADDIALQPLNALLVDMSLTPDAIADVFQVLNARGELSSLQLDIADMGAAADDWQFSANFHDLGVDAWRGAPGITSAKGYVELAVGGGYVILDSQDFAMNFPTVYKQPLVYDDVFGTINIHWDADDLKLSSGLLSVEGEEGLARVLFGLNVPLVKNEIGLEMDLLVGLENFDPKYRQKYLPYILSDALLGWLAPSIGPGRIEQGAFLWRGNLHANQPQLKTIQLFFNIADTQLNYHPQWPPVSGVEGIVLIDDTDVSVWSQSGKLHDSDIVYLSAEAWLDEEHRMVLAIAGQLQGPAADGLKIVNNSPITDSVGAVFSEWQASGQLQTQLQLEVVLSGATLPPYIEVETLWRAVDLSIEPGNLAITDVGGGFSYSSEQGFASQDLHGQLWGRPVAAQVSQGELAGVAVALNTRIDMADIQAWLDLDILALAKGETDATIRIDVLPDQGTTLSVHSDLHGVTLDLPQPWAKAASQSLPLDVTLPLGGDINVLELTLAQNLHFHMQLSQGEFTGAALSFYEPPLAVETGVLSIRGHTPLLDVQQWQDFIARYIEEDLLTSIEAGGGLSVEIDKLSTDTLFIFGQDLRDVVFSAANESGSWQISAETEWAAGSLHLAASGQPWALAVQTLDLDELGQLNMNAPDQGEPLDLPDMAVSLTGLYAGGNPLGGLAFDLTSRGATLTAENITGSLAGLELDSLNPATLRWDQGGQGGTTQLDAMFLFDDLGATLEHLDYEKTLETDSGQFDLALQWPGGPASFSLADARGSLKITLGEGSFLSAPAGASGALRVINILNLAELIGQLSLSQLFKSGIAFHAVTGEVFVADGIIEVANMEVEGSSSGFSFSGTADVKSESLEGNLVVTLPVANNLPWIVALTAGLPVAAGVFVVSKVFQKQVNRFTSGVYRVSGPWDDPEVNFVRIFDDSSAASIRSEIEAFVRQLDDPNTPVMLYQLQDPNSPVPALGPYVPDANTPAPNAASREVPAQDSPEAAS